MTYRKWNYEKHEYEPFEVPNDKILKTYSNDMEEVVNCCQCLKEMTFGEGYTKQRNGMNLRKERLLTPQKDHKGYLYVRLYNENGWKYFKIYILVAKTFIPNLLNEPTVDHIDRNKENNKIDNLRWTSYKEQENNKDKTYMIERMRQIGKSKKGCNARWN